MHIPGIFSVLVFMFLLSPLAYSLDSGEDFIRAGESFIHRMDYDQAIYCFSRAIEDNPNSVEALLHRGRAYILKDRYHEAMDDYRKALELDATYVLEWFRKNRTNKKFRDEAGMEYTYPEYRDAEADITTSDPWEK